MSTAAMILTPDLLPEFARQVAAATPCELCGGDPVLVVRNQFVRVYVAHLPGCAALGRPLQVVPGGGS